MRLFVAVNLPPAERLRIQRATQELRGCGLPVRWVASDAYHLTLKFLGEVADARVEELGEVVVAVAADYAPFPIRLRGAGAFPTLRRPSVWWIGVEQSERLAALYRSVDAAFSTLGFPPEARPFSPHLTLGRTRPGSPRGPLEGAAGSLQRVDFDRTITVETLDLMRSQLSATGARYQCLRAAALLP